MNLHEIETALEAGRIYACMSHGKHWQVRRNGRTQTWKTRPGDWRIPVKAGLRACGELTHRNWDDDTQFVIVPYGWRIEDVVR